MQLMPDWLYGFVPPEWWPDRPREPFFWGISLLPMSSLAGSPVETVEMVFDKKRDVLVWGGCAHLTNGASLFLCPISGTSTQVLVRLRNPAAAVNYSDGTIVGAATGGSSPGFVPLESLFSAYQFVGLRAALWPMPIPIPKGGSLMMDLVDMNPSVKHLRFTFWTSLMYEEREFVA